MPTSPLWALRLPATTGEQPDVPLALSRLAVDLEAILAGHGLANDKPTSSAASPGKPGRRWYATDTGIEYVDTGTGWAIVGGSLIGDYKYAARTADHEGWAVADGRECAATWTRVIDHLTSLGKPFGTGGSGRPLLPDFRGRVPLHPGSAAGDATATVKALGEAGGEEKHLLIATESGVAAHGHGLTDPGHAHGVNDPGHGHGVSDPGHGHDISTFHTNPQGASQNWGGQWGPTIVQTGPPAPAIGFFTLYTSVATGKAYGNGTGISIQGSGTGLSVRSGGTGMSVNGAAAADAAKGHNNLQPYAVGGCWFIHL